MEEGAVEDMEDGRMRLRLRWRRSRFILLHPMGSERLVDGRHEEQTLSGIGPARGCTQYSCFAALMCEGPSIAVLRDVASRVALETQSSYLI